MSPGMHDTEAPPDLPEVPERERQKEALQAAGNYLYGQWGWQTRLAHRVAVAPRTMRRWISGQDPVPGTAWELVKLLVRWKAEYGDVP